MTKPIIYALDFDGVLCDSAIETGMAAWKAATRLWNDMSATAPEPFIEQFRQARPILETGYEALIILRLLFEGVTVEALLNGFEAHKQAFLARENIAVPTLKTLFSTTRDEWIRDFPEQWVGLNPLFAGVKEKLQNLSAQGEWYVLTTKQERFVVEILKANAVNIPEQRIFGLDSNIPKDEVLSRLLQQYPEHSLVFIEDRLQSLVKVKQSEHLQSIRLQLANWGYNTVQDRQDAERAGIEIIGLEDFLVVD